MAPMDVAPRPFTAPQQIVCRPSVNPTLRRVHTGRPRLRPVECAVASAWGVSVLRRTRGRRHRHAAPDGKTSSEPSGAEEGGRAEPPAPNDRDVDHQFTAAFNAYTAAYFSPHRRFWRWARWRLQGLWPRTSKQRPNTLQRLIAAVGYLLPLGVALRLLSPTFVEQSGSIQQLWRCLLVITSPFSTLLGALTAASWLICSLTDQEPSDFIRCHFRQALMLTSLSALLVFQERAFSPELMGAEGRIPVVLCSMMNGLLGTLLFVWLISVFCCLLGRYVVRTTDLSGSRLVES